MGPERSRRVTVTNSATKELFRGGLGWKGEHMDPGEASSFWGNENTRPQQVFTKGDPGCVRILQPVPSWSNCLPGTPPRAGRPSAVPRGNPQLSHFERTPTHSDWDSGFRKNDSNRPGLRPSLRPLLSRRKGGLGP